MPRYRFVAKADPSSLPEIQIFGEIGDNWDEDTSNDAKTIIDQMKAINGPLIIKINSIGGSLADALAIATAIDEHPYPVTTLVMGVAYSAGGLIAMRGRPVRMAANAVLMIHAPMGSMFGNAADLREAADALDTHARAMVSAYVRPGGPTFDTVLGWLMDGADHYFTADDAKKIGLIDEISPATAMDSMAAVWKPSAAHHEDIAMPDPITPPVAAVVAQGQDTQQSAVERHSLATKKARDDGIQVEANRRRSVEAVFVDFYDADPLNPVSALRDACLNDTACDELGARRQLLNYLASKSADPIIAREQYATERTSEPPPRVSAHLGGMPISGGRTQGEKRAEGLKLALGIRAGLITDKKIIDAEYAGNEYLARSLVEIMAMELRAAGQQPLGRREDVVRQYLGIRPILAAGPSHGTDSLPNILGNIANLSAMQGWEGSTETWAQWTQSGQLSNYQTHTRANLALLGKLEKMIEHQPWNYGQMADVKQRITGFFHGLRYALGLQSIVNDDLGELTRAMNGWGEAASATIGDAVYAVLTVAGSGGVGQTMDEDSKPLFHADHGNYVTSGADPSETTLNTARAAMATLTDQNNRKIAIKPQFIIHGPALFATVHKVLTSQQLQQITVDGATGATVLSGGSNAVQAMNLTPIEEYRITAGWYLAAARRTIEVAGVDGPVMPRVNQIPVSETPGLTYELSCPFGVAALDYRGLYFNDGA